MAVSDASVTTTTAAAFIPELWSDGALEAVEFGATIQKRVNRSFESDLEFGSILDIGRISNLSTQAKSSGVSNTILFEAITQTKQQVTVATHEYAAFLIEGVVEVQANQDLRARWEKKIGYALARGRDVTLANVFQNFASNTAIGTYGVELASDDYLSAYQNFLTAGLLEDDVDPGEAFSIFLSPAAYVAAMKVDVFINSRYNDAADSIQKCKIGDIYGMPTYVSNLLRSPAGGQHDCVAMHSDAIILIVQKEVPVVSQYLIRNLADGVAGWNLYGDTRVQFPAETPGSESLTDNRATLLKTV